MERGERYHVRIDSGLKPGFLTLGDTCIGGTSGTEFLISTYCCHPSLANDNLSGIVLWALLLRELKARKMRHSYRFVIAPETIGAIAYLAQNEPAMRRVSGGFVITTVAGPGAFGYKQSFRGNSIIDRVVYRTFKELDLEYIPYSFDINGSDERQYSTPFYRIPTGTICKDKYYEYPYYHTSLDNLGFISAENLVETLMLYLHSIEKLELDVTYRSLNPWCEPQLGKRGLFPGLGGQIKQNVTISPEPAEKKYRLDEQLTITQKDIDMMVWIMFESDGKTSILDIAERRDFTARELFQTAERLRRHNLIDISPTGREMSGR
jgi:aminopeptidase-like protein